MMNKKLLISIIDVFLSLMVYSQPGFTSLRGAYLGQKLHGDTAELFAPGIVSTDKYEHSAPAFSPDGKTVLWTVVLRGSPSYLLEMKMENEKWTNPARPSFSDTTADDFYPSFSIDGKKLYFSSRRKLPPGYPAATDIQIWEVNKNKEGWGRPMPFDTAIRSLGNYAHSVTRDGTIYLSVRNQGGTNWNIWYSKKIGNRYQKPTLLPYNINGIAYEDGPYISPDESYLIYESERPEGIEGSIDLYICFRRPDGQWGQPINMGDRVNTKYTERFARVSPDGKYLFFGSDGRQSAHGNGADIYWIDAKVIDELRKKYSNQNPIDHALGMDVLLSLDARNYPKAISALKQWLHDHPKDIGAWIHYCGALRDNKQYDDAITISKNALSEFPNNSYLELELVLNMFATDQNEEAEKYIPSIIGAGINERLLYLRVAYALLSMNKNKTSAIYFEKALRIQPSGRDLYNLACAYAKDNEKEKAIDALEKCTRDGYGSRQQLETDPDLQSLRTDERFKALLGRMN